MQKNIKTISEPMLIFLIGAVQFIDIFDFMMVMPLGPDFQKAFGVEISNLGYLSASYTLAAAFTGLLSSILLDRFDRKNLLIFSLLGLVVATSLGGLSPNIEFLLFTRFLAGGFGGPATAAAFAIIADLVEPHRRGAAMGKVWGAFSLASVLGVPFGLEASRLTSWRMPFFIIGIMGILVSILIFFKLPPIRKHIDDNVKKIKVTYRELLNKKLYIYSYLTAALGTMAAFMIIPYISPQLQTNLHLPRDQVSWQYFVGGTISFFAMRAAGHMVDKHSATYTSLIGTLIIAFSLIGGYIEPSIIAYVPIVVVFAPFMVGMSIRNVSSSTNFSKIPTQFDRAGFMSLISCFQHLFSSAGAFLSATILVETADHRIDNMEYIGLIALILFFTTIPLIYFTEKALKHR